MRPLIPALSFLALSFLSACTHLDSKPVELDGHTIEIATAGAGANTVVFEAGLGDDWSPWDEVAYDLVDDARVFAYSRPGLGESDAATTSRAPAQIVGELRGLLTSQGFSPPYVLVGHSTGGGYMELFARSYPEEVAGVVLVDPRPIDFLAECERQGLDTCGIPDDTLATLSETVQAEYAAFTPSEQFAVDFGSYPVRVLTATIHPGSSDARNALWESMQGDIADEAVDGEQIVFEGAGHYLQESHPEEVADVIRSVLP